MARGMVNGEAIVSQANTEAFDEGYERTFGDRKPQRGRWVMTPAGLVPADQYVSEERAVDAPILSGRFYENQRTVDGEDIGSRAKHRDYMRRNGVTAASDYSDRWYERNRQDKKQEIARNRRETIARKLYEIDKP